MAQEHQLSAGPLAGRSTANGAAWLFSWPLLIGALRIPVFSLSRQESAYRWRHLLAHRHRAVDHAQRRRPGGRPVLPHDAGRCLDGTRMAVGSHPSLGPSDWRLDDGRGCHRPRLRGHHRAVDTRIAEMARADLRASFCGDCRLDDFGPSARTSSHPRDAADDDLDNRAWCARARRIVPLDCGCCR